MRYSARVGPAHFWVHCSLYTGFARHALVKRRPYCPGGPIKLCFTTLSLIPMDSIARLSVVKQSSFGLPGQYGRRVTRVNWMAGQWKLFALERTFVPMGKRIYCSCHPTWLPCKTSISRRVYVQSLCYEYQNSFILKFEPFTITKIWHWDSLWKRDIKETFSCGLL